MLCSGVQQHGASVSARGEEDSSSHQTQPQRGGRRSNRQPERPQVQRSILAGGLSRDVSTAPPQNHPVGAFCGRVPAVSNICPFCSLIHTRNQLGCKKLNVGSFSSDGPLWLLYRGHLLKEQREAQFKSSLCFKV